ncbi:MAG TPA: NAD(P)-dependent oxidoreductase [Clostridiales bacterium]|nr:NAD(P)-dependent oxidoreductase [Clostridiales bacterium]
MKRIGFIGVGAMGRGMCENLIQKSGCPMTIFDINQDNANYFSGKAAIASSPAEVLHNSDVLFLSLPNSDVIGKVTDEFFREGVKGKTVIDVSTSYPMATKQLYARFKDEGGVFIDAPLMGGPADTLAGNSPCMVSGDKEEIDKIMHLIECYASPIDYVGESGNAHTIKLAMNFTGLTYAVITAQMFPLMEKMGIDTKNLFRIMNEGSFGNWVFDFYGNKVVNRNYRMDFALELGLKDMTYVKKLYEDFNVPAFTLDGVLDLLRTSLKDGKGKKDFSECAATMYEYLGLNPNK